MDASYNNSGGFSNGVISSGNIGSAEISHGNDIILMRNDGKKTKYRRIVVGIGIGLFAVVAIVVACFILLNDSFGEFRNLVLYGNSEFKREPNDDSYVILQIVNTGDKTKIQKYFEEVKLARNKIEQKDVERHKDAIDIVSLWMDASWFYYYYDDSIVNVFEENGYETAKEYVDGMDSFYGSSNNENVIEGTELLKNARTYFVDFLSAYEANGCLYSAINEECVLREYDIDETVYENMRKKSLASFNSVRVIVDEALENIDNRKEK